METEAVTLHKRLGISRSTEKASKARQVSVEEVDDSQTELHCEEESIVVFSTTWLTTDSMRKSVKPNMYQIRVFVKSNL